MSALHHVDVFNRDRAAVTEETDQNGKTYRSLGGDVLGLFAETGSAASVAQDDAPVIDALMDLVLKARQNYRLQKQYAEADELRDTLGKAGITVEDTKDGARWKR